MNDLDGLLGHDYQEASIDDYSPLPQGDYTFAVNNIGVMDTKSGGKAIRSELVELKTKKRVWHWINIQHSNPEVVKIGMRQLKQMAVSCGHRNPDQIKSTQELGGMQCRAHVVVENDVTYGPGNKIKYFDTKWRADEDEENDIFGQATKFRGGPKW